MRAGRQLWRFRVKQVHLSERFTGGRHLPIPTIAGCSSPARISSESRTASSTSAGRSTYVTGSSHLPRPAFSSLALHIWP